MLLYRRLPTLTPRWLVLAGVCLFVASGLLGFWWFNQRQSATQNHTATVLPTPTPTPIPPKTFLLMGYGGGKHDGGQLTDTMIETYVEPDKQRVTLISIPRDIWLDMPQQAGPAKINYAYASQGLTGAKQAVTKVTGIAPDYAAAIDFAGFINLLHKIEPIEVDVPYTFTDNFYPIEGKETDDCGYSPDEIKTLSQELSEFQLEKQFGCRYETVHFRQGPTKMNAEEALKFVRSRHGSDGRGDFGRSQRQQALILAVKNRLLTPSLWVKFPGLIRDAFKLVETDMTVDELLSYIKLLTRAGDLNQWRFQTIVLDTSNVLMESRATNGAAILQPVSSASAVANLASTLSATPKPVASNDRFASVKQFIQLSLLAFNLTPTPSPSPTPTLNPSPSTSSLVTPVTP